MSISEPFIRRPIATTLLTVAVALSGILAFSALPVSPLPQIDFPTISVNASLPGASPEIVASSIATPLEREFGHCNSTSRATSMPPPGTSRPRSTRRARIFRPTFPATRLTARSTRPTHPFCSSP
jgi:multidrug efflux pump